MDMVAQDVSWASEGGTKGLVRLPISLIRARAWGPKEPKVQIEITKMKCHFRNVTSLVWALGGTSWMVQNSRGGRQSPGLGAGEEQIWRSYWHRRQLLGQPTILMSTMLVYERGASQSGRTKSGVFRRKAPSRWRKDVICLSLLPNTYTTYNILIVGL